MEAKINFLGLVIGEGEVTPDTEMYTTLTEWPEPRTKKELQSFLGFVNYYREFIKGVDQTEQGLSKCFTEVRVALVSAKLLHQPNEDGHYILDTDASEMAIAGILCQQQTVDGEVKECPIAFGSKSLSETEMRYIAPKAEML